MGRILLISLLASRFRWERASLNPKPYPDDDYTWNQQFLSGYKEILVTVDDVESKATFFCILLEE